MSSDLAILRNISETRAKTLPLLISPHKYYAGFATFHNDELTMRVRRCDLFDLQMEEPDLCAKDIDYYDISPSWAQNLFGRHPKYHGDFIFSENRIYSHGYILFIEKNPSETVKINFSQHDWDDLSENLIYLTPDQDLAIALLIGAICEYFNLAGWRAPYRDD